MQTLRVLSSAGGRYLYFVGGKLRSALIADQLTSCYWEDDERQVLIDRLLTLL